MNERDMNKTLKMCFLSLGSIMVVGQEPNNKNRKMKNVKTIERGVNVMHPPLTEKDKQKSRKAIQKLY